MKSFMRICRVHTKKLKKAKILVSALVVGRLKRTEWIPLRKQGAPHLVLTREKVGRLSRPLAKKSVIRKRICARRGSSWMLYCAASELGGGENWPHRGGTVEEHENVSVSWYKARRGKTCSRSARSALGYYNRGQLRARLWLNSTGMSVCTLATQ